MIKDIEKLSTEELAALISGRLLTYGIEAVLSGGSCATIYSTNKYVSHDLDFVVLYEIAGKKVKAAMEEIGFALHPNKFFFHPKCKLIVEFLPDPLSIGSEPVREVGMLKTKFGMLKLLSPTDCVKGRLASFFYYNDPQALEQSVLVAKEQNIDYKEIKRWAIVENNIERYRHFLDKLK